MTARIQPKARVTLTPAMMQDAMPSARCRVGDRRQAFTLRRSIEFAAIRSIVIS